jgi:glycosyltransferase involved in cell wall biosynthesis
MLRFRRAVDGDVVHYQWLTIPPLDVHLLPARRPRVMTAHYILPPRPSRRQVATARRVFGAMDAVVAHSGHSAARLRDEVDIDAGKVHVIPHGAFDYLTKLPEEKPLPPELEGAEGPGRVRFVTRFVEDAEIPAIFRRADLVVLPYLDAEHSGVLYTGLAFGKPLVLSAVGGFPEVAEIGAARLFPPGDTAALATALTELVADEAGRADLAAAATRAAAGPYSWDEAASRTLDLYRELIERRP